MCKGHMVLLFQRAASLMLAIAICGTQHSVTFMLTKKCDELQECLLDKAMPADRLMFCMQKQQSQSVTAGPSV